MSHQRTWQTTFFDSVLSHKNTTTLFMANWRDNNSACLYLRICGRAVLLMGGIAVLIATLGGVALAAATIVVLLLFPAGVDGHRARATRLQNVT